ncbi:MAG: biopolymer transporter ExbD [Pseudomonadota bacterium]
MSMSRRAVRMERKHKKSKMPSLNLVSLMDIFTILVFFLLVNSSDVETLQANKGVQLPESVAEQKPRENVVVMITATDILVQGEPTISLSAVTSRDDTLIPELKNKLQIQVDKLIAEAGEDERANREVTIMGDKSVPYSVLKKVMATCTDADYGRLSLAVMQRGAPDGGES